VVRAVRVTPNDPSCAALTFVFTGYPGLFVHAGLLHDFPFPVCGCDACDQSAVQEIDALEELVFAVVTGNYRETVTRGPRAQVERALRFPSGGSSGRGPAKDLPAARLSAATPILRSLADGWAAWPPRR
ncbi:MAG: DUF6226 family protein, partial [Microbacterium sp.]